MQPRALNQLQTEASHLTTSAPVGLLLLCCYRSCTMISGTYYAAGPHLSLAFHKFLSRIQLSHNLAFPMTTWQLSLNLALYPCLDTPIKDTCIRSNHIILTEIYEIPCLLGLIFFQKIVVG